MTIERGWQGMKEDSSGAGAPPRPSTAEAPEAWTAELRDHADESALYWDICSANDLVASVFTTEQHARLIAAAPDLLALLCECWVVLQVIRPENDWSRIEAAIAKAEGP